MILYRRIKLLEHFLNNGLITPSRMKVVEGVSEDKDLGIDTIYDKALYTLGFDKFLQETYNTSVDGTWTLHEAFVKMLSEFIGEDYLNKHERSTLYNIESKTLEETLNKNKRYTLDKKYYQTRVEETKEQKAELAYVMHKFHTNIKRANPVKLEDDVHGNMVLKFEKNMTGVKVRNYDDRMLATFSEVNNLPYTGHIHPYVFLKVSKYLLPFSNKKKTLYMAMATEEPGNDIFEVLMLLLLETKLLGSNNIVEYIDPIIKFGEIYSNMVCAAYMVPEMSGKPEHIVVGFRYDDDVTIITDRTYLKDVVEFRGLGLDEDGVAIIKRENIKVWDSIFKGAYKPKNGDYNDIRQLNLTK